ncbi:Smr/MutS family protein [Candidatus Pelagibacter bacterium]|nr:Smr/MutS family protein [Candidatus Pelagibacter bacterium]
MIKKKDLSKEDKETWDNFTRQPSDIYDKDLQIADDNPKKNRLRYDLHGFTLEDANKKVKDLILSGIRNKYKEILLITGKGLHSNTEEDTYVSKNLSKLRFSVPEFINSCDELSKFVVSISEASLKDGGSGAILIKLKNL